MASAAHMCFRYRTRFIACSLSIHLGTTVLHIIIIIVIVIVIALCSRHRLHGDLGILEVTMDNTRKLSVRGFCWWRRKKSRNRRIPMQLHIRWTACVLKTITFRCQTHVTCRRLPTSDFPPLNRFSNIRVLFAEKCAERFRPRSSYVLTWRQFCSFTPVVTRGIDKVLYKIWN